MSSSAFLPARQYFLLPSWRQWLAVSAILLGLLVVIDVGVPSNALRVWYWMRVVGPQQEARYGFHAELDSPGYGLHIVSVAEGGAFQKAGIRAGWVSRQLTCFGYSQAELLYGSLEDPGGAGGTVALRFLTGAIADNGMPRWVLVPIPRQTQRPAA